MPPTLGSASLPVLFPCAPLRMTVASLAQAHGCHSLEPLMPTHIEVLEAEVLSLSIAERSRLLERLVASLDSDPEIEEAWIAEAGRREAEISNGSIAAVPGDEAIARLRARFK